MTPTPGETALWRALNVEPDIAECFGNNWEDWHGQLSAFTASHPVDRLAYFEGLVRACRYQLSVIERPDYWVAVWGRDKTASAICEEQAPTELDARFHAACRALAALG